MANDGHHRPQASRSGLVGFGRCGVGRRGLSRCGGAGARVTLVTAQREGKRPGPAAEVLRDHADAVVVPAEDGGYALIGMRTPQPALFSDMPWSTPLVMYETRRRLRTLGLPWHEPVTLWDVDLPQDLERMRGIGLHDLIPSERS